MWLNTQHLSLQPNHWQHICQSRTSFRCLSRRGNMAVPGTTAQETDAIQSLTKGERSTTTKKIRTLILANQSKTRALATKPKVQSSLEATYLDICEATDEFIVQKFCEILRQQAYSCRPKQHKLGAYTDTDQHGHTEVITDLTLRVDKSCIIPLKT